MRLNIYERNGDRYLLVTSQRLTFTGKPAYGLVHLGTGQYNDLDLSLVSITELLARVGLRRIADDTQADYPCGHNV